MSEVFKGGADNIEISDFSIKGGNVGVYIYGPSPTIQNNSITNNKYGIYIYSAFGASALVVNNSISGNEIWGVGSNLLTSHGEKALRQQ